MPVANGTLGIWLFLTTEFMLFAALIGAWLVLRFSAGSSWPTAETMHAKWPIGLLNTLVLLASGWTAWQATRRAESFQAGRGRIWIVSTMLLGGVFLAIKAFEFREKQALGLIGAGLRPGVSGVADAQYVSDVLERLRELGANQPLTAARPESGASDSPARRGEELASATGDVLLIQQGLAGWTARQAGRTNNDTERRALYHNLSAMIFPPHDVEAAKTGLAAERKSLTMHEIQLAELQVLRTEKLKSLQAELAAIDNSVDKVSPDAAAQKAEAAVVTLELTEINGELVAIRQRLAALARSVPLMDRGLNRELGLGLPVAIPGGPAWMSTWLLLTGMHAVHVVGGLLVWAWLLVAPESAWWRAAVENSARYWHFVDAVWLVIFAVVYF